MPMADTDRTRLKRVDPGAGDLPSTGRAVGVDPSAAELFALVWEDLCDILGTAATAALLRRAARGAMARCPELGALAIVRAGLEYRYELPADWNDRTSRTPTALRELVDELRALLVELTGSVVVRRLARIPELRERGILFLAQEDEP